MATYSKINFIEPEKLIPYDKNAKTHPDSQLTKLVRLIENYGFPESKAILVDEDLIIIAGHGRRLASISAGLKQVPYQIITNISEADKKALRIADNAVGESEWNYDFLKQEYQDLELEDFDMDLLSLDDIHFEAMDLEIEKNNSDLDEDKLDEIPNKDEVETRAKTGDIWQLGNHFLLCGDCTIENNIKALLGDKKVDMIFTDPPYGVSYADKNKYLNSVGRGNKIQIPIENDHLTLEDTGKLWANVFRIWSNVLSEYSSYYIASPQGGDLFLMMMTMNENGFPLKHCLIWVKNNHVLGRCDYNYKHEPLLFGWKNKHRFYGNGEHKFSTWEIPKPLKNDLHPTMKPVELVENAILNSTERNMIVADPFLGSGTTLIACEKTNRICYGTEISEKYCDVIITRWENLTGKPANLIRNIL
jgi:DNA modification methylase